MFEKDKELFLSSALNVNTINEIVVPESTRLCVEVQRASKKIHKNNITFEDYLLVNKKNLMEREPLHKVMSDNKIRKSIIERPIFLIYLSMKKGIRIELAIRNYQTFKHLLNDLHFLMKNYDSLVPLAGRISQEKGI